MNLKKIVFLAALSMATTSRGTILTPESSNGDLITVSTVQEKLISKGCSYVELTIDPLTVPWGASSFRHYQSGNAPILALKEANNIISSGEADAVIISGTDPLWSGYAPDRRRNLMDIYKDANLTIPEAYTELAKAFIEENEITESEFTHFAEILFNNYVETASKRGITRLDRLTEKVTPLFAKSDCANPVVDFDGKLILGNEETADLLGISDRVYLLGVGVDDSVKDGPGNEQEIAEYHHLISAYNTACSAAGINFKELFLGKEALLEAYTCFPIVPLAFLLKTGIAEKGELDGIIRNHPLTVTGGMNLARAPWNNPALHALIVMYHKLLETDTLYGGVHGNGGLGYSQGFAVIGRH